MPRRVKELASRPGIIASGHIENLGPLYRSAALAVVPVRVGGGTRIKVLEAAAHGVPVVATRFGAAGTGFRSGQELLLADDEAGFAAVCAKLLINGALALRLASQAKRKLRRDFSRRRCAARFLGMIEVPAV